MIGNRLSIVGAVGLFVLGCTSDNPDSAADADTQDMSVPPTEDGDMSASNTDGGSIAEECRNLASAVCDSFARC